MALRTPNRQGDGQCFSSFMTHLVSTIPHLFCHRNPTIGISFHRYLKAMSVLLYPEADLTFQHAIMSTISVRFQIDKQQERVVFAEAGSDFIDVLFSFLTLPLGSIVHLLGKQSGLASLDKLYNSVEQLDVGDMQTEACKEMLLNPRSAAAIICEDLKIKNIHDANPRRFYFCSGSDCLLRSPCYYTYETKSRCRRCKQLISKHYLWQKETSDKGGVFVTDRANFIITDDLQVIPTSLMRGWSILKELGIKDASLLEERVIDFGTKEVLNLLRRSLVSKTALSEFCLPDVCVQTSAPNCSSVIKEEMDANEEKNEIVLKLVLNKEKNNVLNAEVGVDFVNQLLSFLTFPLGSVLRLISDRVSLHGCIANLYSSVESMGLDHFKSENCRNMLLNPKLEAFYGFENQILKLEENTSKTLRLWACQCYFDDKPCNFFPCKKGISPLDVLEQNPKSTNIGVMDTDVAFVVDSRTFMIADNLLISPLSFSSAIGNEMKLPIDNIVGKDVCLDKVKALSLLSAMLISKTVLTDVFCPKPKRCKRSRLL